MKRLAQARRMRHVKVGFSVAMPDNVVVLVNLIPSPDQQETMLIGAKEKTTSMAETVKARVSCGVEGKTNLSDRLENILMRAIVTKIFWNPTRFKVHGECIKCGTCLRICPTNNIKIAEEGIMWGKNCAHCLACLHWCPAGAITIGRKTAKRRFHHPEIQMQEMILR